MDLIEALRTTGSCRSFTDEAVGDDVDSLRAVATGSRGASQS